jgi:hypothetical protein
MVHVPGQSLLIKTLRMFPVAGSSRISFGRQCAHLPSVIDSVNVGIVGLDRMSRLCKVEQEALPGLAG